MHGASCKDAAVQHKELGLGKIDAQDFRGVLGDNVKRLRGWYKDRNDPERSTQEGVGRLSGLSQTTVGRIEKGSHATELDTITALANAFKVEPWQMLCPDFDPSDPYLTIRKSVYQRIRDALSGISGTDLPPPP